MFRRGGTRKKVAFTRILGGGSSVTIGFGAGLGRNCGECGGIRPLFSLRLIRWEYGITEGMKDLIGCLALKEPCRQKLTYGCTENYRNYKYNSLNDESGDMWGFLVDA
jgi:hypothetical protein